MTPTDSDSTISLVCSSSRSELCWPTSGGFAAGSAGSRTGKTSADDRRDTARVVSACLRLGVVQTFRARRLGPDEGRLLRGRQRLGTGSGGRRLDALAACDDGAGGLAGQRDGRRLGGEA